MKKFFIFLLIIEVLFTLPSNCYAGSFPLFDIDARKADLQKPEFAKIKSFCEAGKIEISDKDEGLKPILELKATEGYGTDRSINDVAWYLMVNAGRVMAGDKSAESKIKKVLLEWSGDEALYKTKEDYDPYYALKRALLPMITSYAIIKDSLSDDENRQVEAWLDNLVRRVNATFNGDVDSNNHRYLADSVLTLWGAYTGDDGLYEKGVERFNIALDQMQKDGSLPLEARRGARALWYTRQSLADLTLIAEVAKSKGDNLYSMEKDGKSLGLLVNYYVSGIEDPMLVLKDASKNYIPGPSNDFMSQDMGMLETRSGRRHLMAWGELYQLSSQDKFSTQRLKNIMNNMIDKERPLIDDYIGGNATCFWARP